MGRRYRGSYRGKGDPVATILVFAIVIIVIVVAILLAPWVSIIVGIVFYATSGSRQAMINEFNSEIVKWSGTEAYPNGDYGDFQTWFNTISLSYTFDGLSGTMSESIDQSTTYKTNFEELKNAEDEPIINTEFKNFHYTAMLDYDYHSVTFDRSDHTYVQILTDGTDVHSSNAADTFKRTTYSCNCRTRCSGSGKNRKCSTVCDTCYRRHYLNNLCYVITHEAGVLQPCYGDAEQFDEGSKDGTSSRDSYFSSTLGVAVQIKHKNDPEVILYRTTNGAMHFGLTKGQKIIIGTLCVIGGGIGAAIEIILFIGVPCFIFFKNTKGGFKFVKKLKKRHKRAQTISNFVVVQEKRKPKALDLNTPIEYNKKTNQPINNDSINIQMQEVDVTTYKQNNGSVKGYNSNPSTTVNGISSDFTTEQVSTFVPPSEDMFQNNPVQSPMGMNNGYGMNNNMMPMPNNFDYSMGGNFNDYSNINGTNNNDRYQY